MLRLSAGVHAQIVGHCLGGLPDEACGLLGGNPTASSASTCYPTRNAAASAQLYSIDGLDYAQAERDADAKGQEIIAVFHSHTHTDAYPSPTDVAQANPLFPNWHYVLVSLRDTHPVLRSYRIFGGRIEEEPVIVDGQ
jgi:proteasome lid subunit RPN8/RPN11